LFGLGGIKIANMNKDRLLKKFINSQLLISCLLLLLGLLQVYVVYLLANTYDSMIWKFLDSLISTFSIQIRQESITLFMMGLSWWGYYGTVIIWVILGLLLYKRRDLTSLGLVVILSLGGICLGYGIKNLVQRERPTEFVLIQEVRQSFPSMHVLSATILYISLIYFLYHFTHNFLLSVVGLFSSILIIFAIGFSRVYLGVHYLSDCIAGFILGLSYFYIVIGLTKLYWVKRYSLLENIK
jgi:undecaprenyl-diphosphatase